VTANGAIIPPAKTGAIFRKNLSSRNIVLMTENILSTRRPK
jgi:hypothetical protein